MSHAQDATNKSGRHSNLALRAQPDSKFVVEDSPRRVRVIFNGETIADSSRMKLVHETGHMPVYYFPFDDVRKDLIERTDHSAHSPIMGIASHWNVKVGDRVAENALWSYESSVDSVPELEGLAAFKWRAMDHWYEEDEEVFVHARDPYKRIDTVPSSRHVQVWLGGEIVADTTRGHFLFETGLPTRYYIPREDVRAEILGPSTLETACPYKGTAGYFSATVSGRFFKNIIWTYPDPIPECPKIKNLLCFFNEKVDTITVDGLEIPKQKTPWSDD